MISHDNVKALTLEADKLWQRPWQLFSNNERILQENGTNPRIRQLPIEQIIELTGLTDKILAYEARIIKSPALLPLIRPDYTWSISFDNGQTKNNFSPILFKESRIQNLAWIVILSK